MAERGGGFTHNVNGEESSRWREEAAGLQIMLMGKRVADGGKSEQNVYLYEPAATKGNYK